MGPLNGVEMLSVVVEIDIAGTHSGDHGTYVLSKENNASFLEDVFATRQAFSRDKRNDVIVVAEIVFLPSFVNYWLFERRDAAKAVHLCE